MKLWKLLLGALLITTLLYASVAYLFIEIANDVDNNGGLKSVVNRIWEGNKK
jgi:amino acid transporter